MRDDARRLLQGAAVLVPLLLLVPAVVGGVLWFTHDADSSGRASEHPADTSSDFSFRLGKSDVPSTDPGSFNETVPLGDGRRVAMYYAVDKGLVEQHYSPGAGAWSKPSVVQRTRTDACQGIDLKAASGTVTAIADFGLYCEDGEPPTESVAAVASGDLDEWDVHRTDDFDGWERASIRLGGRYAEFEYGAASLTWLSGAGFVDAEGL